MPACSICTYAERDAIDAALVSGASLRGLARVHSVTASALRRHRDAGHLLRSRPTRPGALDRALAAVVAQSRMLPGQTKAAPEVRVVSNVPRRSVEPPPIIDEGGLAPLNDGNGHR